MATRIKPELETERATHTTEFLKSDVDSVMFYDHPMIDNIVTSILALGSEIWANQRRMLVHERLLEEKGITREMVEAYMPTEEDVTQWEIERNGFVERALGPLMRETSQPPSAKWQDND